jgi:ribosome maturation factor RimP
MAFALDKVREIAERVAGSSGLEVWDLELKGSGAARTLRIFIDKPDGVSHEDCAAYSREVATIFDVEEAVPGGKYLLEISSPGLDRRLLKAEHFARFSGSRIKLTTRQPVSGSRHFEGRLSQFAGDELTLDLVQASRRGKSREKAQEKIQEKGPERLVVALGNVEKASVVPEF